MTFRHLAPVLWIALCLIALEVALEYRAMRRGWETLLFGEPAAAARAGDTTWGPQPDFAFRSKRIAPERTPGTARVWFASASYGEDTQLPPDAVFPNRTGELLREQGFACEVLNSSHAGDSILSNVRDLAELGPLYRPDAVVLYEMSNDVDRIAVELCSRGWVSTRKPKPLPPVDPLAEASPSAHGQVWAERLFERTTVFKHLKSEITARLSKGRRLASTLESEGELRFEPRLRSFLAQCRSLGATPVLCTFATAYTHANWRDTPQEYELNLLRFNVHLSLEGWLESVERFNGVIRRVAQEEGVTLVDLEREVAGRAELFRDMWHLREPGHRRAAALLSASLAELPALAGARAR